MNTIELLISSGILGTLSSFLTMVVLKKMPKDLYDTEDEEKHAKRAISVIIAMILGVIVGIVYRFVLEEDLQIIVSIAIATIAGSQAAYNMGVKDYTK